MRYFNDEGINMNRGIAGAVIAIAALLFIATFVIGCGNTLRGLGQGITGTIEGVGQDINKVTRN